MASDERTEAATPRRRQQAREKGEVARSTEIGSVVVLLAGFLTFQYFGGYMYQEVAGYLKETLGHLSMADLTIEGVEALGGAGALVFLRATAPLLLVALVAGVASSVAQTGLLFTAQPLLPDLSRVNPLRGLTRMFSGNSLVELVKALFKIAVVGWVVYRVLEGKLGQLTGSYTTDLMGIGLVAGHAILEMGIQSSLVLFVMAVGDYAYRYWDYEKRLKMTREEAKEEQRQYEGSPLVRAKIRQQQRAFAGRRMMQSVPRATVVVANPTHVAVALEYRTETMPAPKVTAKGAHLVAERIMEIARQNRVPIVQDRPLAWALFRFVDVGQTIPMALYQAVAELLAFVYRLSERARRLGDIPPSWGAAGPQQAPV